MFANIFEEFYPREKRDIIKNSYFDKMIFRTNNGDCKYLHTYCGVTILEDPWISHIGWKGRVEWCVKAHIKDGTTKQTCLSGNSNYYPIHDKIETIYIGAVEYYK